MKSSFLTMIASLAVIGFAGTARAAGQYLKIDHPVSTATAELQVAVTYTLWIQMMTSLSVNEKL